MPEKTPENTETNSSASSKISPELILQIASLCDEWNKTESWIKQGELVTKKALMPSINEMRYAGRQIVDACHAASNNSNAGQHLVEARSTLLKARHDVVDSIVIYISDNADNHRDRLHAGNLHKNFSNYEELFGLLKTITDKILLSREDRNHRDEIYGEIMKNDMSNLIKFHKALNESLPAIEQTIKREGFRALLLTSCTIIGAIGAVFTIGMIIYMFIPK